MHIVFGTALLIIAVLLIVGILSRRHWISTVLAVAIALIGVATIYTSTSIGPSSERQLYARAVLDNLSARLFGSDAGFRTDPKMVARFETLKQRPAELTAFLRAMPKGGDLHNHLSGAIYAESYLDWARAGSLCVDQAALALRPPPCRPLLGTVPLEDVLTGKTGPDLTRDRLIDALSVRNYEIYDRSGHDQFFATFGAFDAAGDGKSGAMPAEVMHRAAEQNISYLELMMSPGMSGARALASALTQSGATSLGGTIPVNPSGGLESKGHPVGATGLAQIFELTTQLRGEAGGRQVENARYAIAENGGGFHGIEEAIACVTILGRA